MPLLTGKKAKTKKGFQKNVETEKAAGKSTKQAVKIAYVKKEKEPKKSTKKMY